MSAAKSASVCCELIKSLRRLILHLVFTVHGSRFTVHLPLTTDCSLRNNTYNYLFIPIYELIKRIKYIHNNINTDAEKTAAAVGARADDDETWDIYEVQLATYTKHFLAGESIIK